MTLTPKSYQDIQRVVALLARVPLDADLWVEMNGCHELRFQGHTQENVRRIRACFPGVVWTKKYEASCAWWTYSGTFDGVHIYIYAVSENPPTCRVIEEETTVEEDVPVTFERRMVTKKVKRVECDPAPEMDAVPA